MGKWRPLLRKIAPLILLLGGIAVGAKLCTSQNKLVQVVVRYDLGEGFGSVRELAAEYRPAGKPEAAPVVVFRTTLLAQEVTHKTRMPAGGYDVAIVLTMMDGTTRELTRRIDVSSGATIRIDLAP